MRWKMNHTMLRDEGLLSQLRQQWSGWKSKKPWFPNVNIWWDRYVKPRLQRYMRIWGAERRQDFNIMENHMYTCIYNIQKSAMSPDQKLAALNRHRAKLVRLQARRTEPFRLDANERDVMDGEEKSLYHLFKSSKRREARTIRRMQDRGGRITNDPKEIEHIFVTYLTDKYGSVDVADNCITEMVNVIRSHTQPSCVAYLEQSIRAEELYTAIMSGGPNKSPRSDGIGREFFLHLWDTIRDDMLQVLNHMNLNKSTTRRQQHGIIFSLPKNNGVFTPAGYRSISLMNTDYKLLARIMARHLTPVLEEHLTSGQYCSVPGRSILEAVSVIRDVVAHAELTRTHVCVLSLDFRNAFDRVSY